MNKIFMMGALMVLALGAPTQAEIKDRHMVKNMQHCMDALTGREFGNMAEHHAREKCQNAIDQMTWGALKDSLDHNHAQGVQVYMDSHNA
jgi:hypothetical protein